MSSLEELASSPVFIALDEQVANGVISAATAESLKQKYAELYRCTLNVVEREKDTIAKAKELRTQVRDEQLALERARVRKEQLEAQSEAVDVERKQLSATLSELESRTTNLEAELNELRLQEKDLAEDVEVLRRENESNVLPVLNNLTDEISETKADVTRSVLLAESLQREIRDSNHKLEELQEMVTISNNTAMALRSELHKVRADPSKVNKAVETVKRTIEETNREVTALRGSLAARDAEIAEQSTALREIRSVRGGLEAKLGRYRTDITAREAEVETLTQSLRSERSQYRDLLERRLQLQAEEVEAKSGARMAEVARDASVTAYERAKHELKRKLDLYNEAVALLPTHEAALRDRQVELDRLRGEGRDLEVTVTKLKREMDTLIASFLREETIEKKHRNKLSELRDACAALESEKEQWHREEALALKQISALKAQRDIKSRELAKLVTQRRLTVENSKMKELQLIDLTKQLSDINARLKQFAAMYEVIKNERNTYATAIQAASQSIAEMRERIKILHNEVDILQNESVAKDKALAKERQAHAISAAQRDMLRVEANKITLLYKERQASVENQIINIDKLNAIINALEREMLSLRRRYETAVETRNYTGISLIDRNDELCILYEKSNIHDRTLAQGESALIQIEDEIRGLKIQASDLERQLHLARSKFPETPQWAEKILELQKSLVQARQVTEKICMELEKPGVSDRWVNLGGDDPETDTLKARVSGLEARINICREELLEKDLILEEIQTLTERLRTAAAGAGLDATTGAGSGIIALTNAAAAGSGTAVSASTILHAPDAPGLTIAKQVNDLQARIREVTRRMMAVVSELSMYQATSIKLSAEVNSAHETLEKARAAFDRGLAPSLAAEHKWQAMERARMQPVVPGGRLEIAGLDGPMSTAEIRPNAYIPEGIGLPRPYGEFAPFKPTEPGAIMRHYRPPQPADITL